MGNRKTKLIKCKQCGDIFPEDSGKDGICNRCLDTAFIINYIVEEKSGDILEYNAVTQVDPVMWAIEKSAVLRSKGHAMVLRGFETVDLIALGAGGLSTLSIVFDGAGILIKQAKERV